MQHNRAEQPITTTTTQPLDKPSSRAHSTVGMSSMLDTSDSGTAERWVQPRMSIFAGMPGLASVGVGLENAGLPNRPGGTGGNEKGQNEEMVKREDGENNGGTEEQEGDARNNSPQNWGELKTKAGKDRKRLPLACIACRRKKIRCSGEKPACKHCVRARLPCVYKQSARKFTPRTDYMATLDKRMKRMEERLLKYTSKEAAASLGPIARSIVKPGPSTHQTGGTELGKSGRKRSADKAFGDASTARDTFISDIAARKALGDVNEDILEEGKDKLPSEEIQQHLAEVFFDCAYGQTYLLLHKPSFMRRLREGTVPPVLMLGVCALAARFSTHPAVKHDPPYLAGQEWGFEASRLVLKNFDKANLTNLTVCILLGLHEFGTCNAGKSWYFGGMAVRMAHALQLHKEADHNPLGIDRSSTSDGNKSKFLSFTDREIRRRLMWSCFLMDRFNSSGTLRPQLLQEQDIEIQLPVRERMFILERPGLTEGLDGVVRDAGMRPGDDGGEMRNNMGVAAYTLKVIALYGRVMRYLNLGGKERDPNPIWYPNSGFSELDGQLQQLKESFPPHMEYTLENLNIHAAEKLEGQFMFLHIAWHQILLVLHRYSIPIKPGAKPPADIPAEFLRSSVQTSFKAANTIATIFYDAEKRQCGVYAPFMGYTSFAAATVHVVGSFSKNPAIMNTAKHNLTVCVNYLTKMAKYWGVLYPLWESLKEQYDQHSKAANTPGAMDLELEEEDSSNILQYGDWFQKYPGIKVKNNKNDDEDTSGSVSPSRPADDDEPVKEKHVNHADPVMRKGADLVTPENFLKKLQEDRVRSPPGGSSGSKSGNKRQASKVAVGHNRSTSTSKSSPKRDDRDRAILRGHGPEVATSTRPGTMHIHAMDKGLPRSSAPDWNPGIGMQGGIPQAVPPTHQGFPTSSQEAPYPVETGGFVSYPPYMSSARPLSDAASNPSAYMVDSYPYDNPNYEPNGNPQKGYAQHTPEIGSSLSFGNNNLAAEGFPGPNLAAEQGDRILPDADGLFASQSAWFLPFNYSPPGAGMELQGLGLQQMLDGVNATDEHNPGGYLP